jgi:hypothetical protein
MRSTTATGIALASAAILLTGCVSAGIEIETGRSDPYPSFAASPANTYNPAGGYFGLGDCAAPEPTRGEGVHREVACNDPAATAEVLRRTETGSGTSGLMTQADCPENADFILDVSQSLTALGIPVTNDSMRYPYACMRNLTSPSSQ